MASNDSNKGSIVAQAVAVEHDGRSKPASTRMSMLDFVRSPLTRKIAAVVFAAIMVVEAIILLPSYLRKEGELLTEIRDIGTQWVLAAEKAAGPDGDYVTYAKAVLKAPMVTGVSIIETDGTIMVRVGEDMTGAQTRMGKPGTHHRSSDGNRYESVWTQEETQMGHAVVLRLDSSSVAGDLDAYVLRILGLIFIVTAVLTLATIAAMGGVVLGPLVNLRNALAEGGDTDWSGRNDPAMKRPDEIGEVYRATSALLGELGEARAELKARVEERTAELARQKTFLDTTLENVDQGIAMYDKDMRLQAWNRRFAELRELPDEFLDGRPTLREIFLFQANRGIYKDLDGDAEAQADYWVERATASGTLEPYEQPRPDGTVHEVRGQRLADGGIVRTFTDITKRKRAEEALRESEKRYETITSNVPGVVYQRIMKPDGSISYPYVSPGVGELYGLDADAVMADSSVMLSVLHPDSKKAFYDSLKVSAENLEPWNAEFQVITADGVHKWVRGSSRVYKTEDGEIFWDGFLVDVSETKRAEEAVRASEAQLKAILQASPVGVLIAAEGGHLKFWNSRWWQMAGAGDTDWREIDIRSFYTSDDDRKRVTELLRVDGSVRDEEVEFRRLDGDTIWLAVNMETLIFEGEAATISWFYDLTERRRAESAQRELLAAIPLPLVMSSAESHELLFVNEPAHDAYGLKVGTGSGEQVTEVYADPNDRKALVELLKRDGRVDGFEARINSRAGTEEWVLMSARSLEYQGQQAVIVASNIITERKRLEQEVAEKEALIRLALDNMSDGIYVLDKDLNFLIYNDRYLELVEWPKESIQLGQSVREVILKMAREGYYGDGDPNEITEQRVADLAGDDFVHREVTIGAERIVDVRKSPLIDGGAVITLTDITERKKAEQIQRSLIEAIPTPIFVVRDSDSTCVYVNDPAASTLGRQVDDIIDRPIIDFYAHPEQRSRLIEVLARDGRVDGFEIQLLDADGQPLWVLISSRQVSFQGEASILTAWTAIDELKAAEDILKQAKEDAEALARSKSEFVAVVSHEVRTPMNGVLGMARLLRETKMDGDQRECVDTILASGESLLRIVDDLLDISKLEAGRLELEAIPFIAADVVEQSIAVMASRAGEKGLQLNCEIDPEIPPVVLGDPHRLRQVLLNLISNAVKFTAEGSVQVDVRAASHDGVTVTISFAIIDTGQGIKQETQDKLFSPYTQGAVEVARKYGGTGLGLAICRRLVEIMGGEIALESAIGEGSTFKFDVAFPIDKETDATELRDASRYGMPASEDGEAPDKPLRILQVEDNATNRKVAERMLSRVGHEVTSVNNGVEAIAIIDSGLFDLVLMDRHMPEMNGLETTQRIRRMDEPLRSLPIVGLTAGAIESELNACLAAGMNAVLTKPVDGRELLATIRHLVAEQEEQTVLPTDRPVLVIDDMQINLTVARRQLNKLGVPCELSTDPVAALDMVKQGDYGAILVDISMPEMDGPEFTQALRAWEADVGSRIPVIAMTGYVGNEERERFLAAGMDDYLAKPVVLEELAGKLSNWLSVSVNGTPANDGVATASEEAQSEEPQPVSMGLLCEILGEEDEADVLDMLILFTEHFPGLYEVLHEATKKQDRGAVHDAAHAAKSAASSAAAEQLTAMLNEIERTSADADWLALDDQADAVLAEFERVKAFAVARQSGEGHG